MNELIEELKYNLEDWFQDFQPGIPKLITSDYNCQYKHSGLTIQVRFAGMSRINNSVQCPIRQVTFGVFLVLTESDPTAYQKLFDALGVLDTAMLGWEPVTPGWEMASGVLEASAIETINATNGTAVTMLASFDLFYHGVWGN